MTETKTDTAVQTVERVGTAQLSQIPLGGYRTFRVPDARAIFTAQVQAYRLARVLGCRFSASADFVNNTITITRMPLTDGARRRRTKGGGV